MEDERLKQKDNRIVEVYYPRPEAFSESVLPYVIVSMSSELILDEWPLQASYIKRHPVGYRRSILYARRRSVTA